MSPVWTANCALWCLACWLRFGGYVLARRSKGGPYPHFLWTDRKRRHVVSFVPADRIAAARPTPLLLTLLFRGRMRWGDQLAGPSYLTGGPKRFLLLRAALMLGIVAVALVMWIAWWVWRVAAIVARLALYVAEEFH